MSKTDAVRRLQAGDTTALNDLYHTYAEPAFRTAFLIIRSRAAAEDAVQEAFVQVVRTISTLRDRAAFSYWFYRIVVNAAKRLARHSHRSVSLDVYRCSTEDLSALTPEEAAIATEEIQAVRAAIAELSEAHREIIVLRYYTGLSEEEIAQTLSIPLGTVKSRLYRAREALAAWLADMGMPKQLELTDRG